MQLLLSLSLADFLLPGATSRHNSSKCRCYRRHEGKREEFVSSPRMHDILELSSLPASLDWRDKAGVNYATMSRNQHIPHYCGACWAFATVSSLSDRVRIARGPTGPEVNLAVQVVLDCDLVDDGCSGGDGIPAYKFIKDFGGLPSETCQAYQAEGHDTGRKCNPTDICRTCDSKGCFAQTVHQAYSVAEYGAVRGEFQMMAELQRGPIACGIATPSDFSSWVGDGIYKDLSGTRDVDHMISVVGYGEEDGAKYWVIRNSWGTYWGHYGFARMARGINNLNIEADCVWATPSDGGHPKLRHFSEMFAVAGSDGGRHRAFEPVASIAAPDAPACRVPRSDWTKAGGERVHGPRPVDEVATDDLPETWDWRNVSGKNFVTSNTNEHSPKYCASCWAQAVTSALSDRLSVKQGGSWPKVGLSPQVLINCHGGGSCNGGDPASAYRFIFENGIVDATCQNYQGKKTECDPRGVCENCAPGNVENGLSWPGTCVAVENPPMYFISQYGSVRGAVAMKAEIYKRGPIGCGLESTSAFRRYRGGVHRETGPRGILNHQVSLAGWGRARGREDVPDGMEFWIGRNSWGTFWGEDGWFRIRMHEEHLGIEHDCDWGVPEQGSYTQSIVPLLVEETKEVEFLQTAKWFALGLVSLVATIAASRSCVLRPARVSDETHEITPYLLFA